MSLRGQDYPFAKLADSSRRPTWRSRQKTAARPCHELAFTANSVLTPAQNFRSASTTLRGKQSTSTTSWFAASTPCGICETRSCSATCTDRKTRPSRTTHCDRPSRRLAVRGNSAGVPTSTSKSATSNQQPARKVDLQRDRVLQLGDPVAAADPTCGHGLEAMLAIITSTSPVAWRHVHLNGRYAFREGAQAIDLAVIVRGLKLAQHGLAA